MKSTVYEDIQLIELNLIMYVCKKLHPTTHSHTHHKLYSPIQNLLILDPWPSTPGLRQMQ